MTNNSSRQNKQALFNILSTAILSGINFLTIPIFTRMLGAEQYGLYSVFHSWVIIIMCFIALECRTGLGTAKYTFEKEYDAYKASSLVLGTSSAIIFISISIVFKKQLSIILGYPEDVVVLIFICAFAFHIVEFAKSAYIYEKKAEKNLILSVSLALLTVILSLVLLERGIPKERYLSRVYGDAFPYIIIALIIWITTFIKKPIGYNRDYWKYCFAMGFPIIFHGLSQDILKQSNRIMLQHMGHGGVEVGIYSFFCTYTAIVNVVLTALNTTWCPFYYDDLNEGAFDRLKVKCKNYFELFTVISCGFLLVSREICYFFSNSEYWSGMDVIPFLVLGIYFIFMYQFPVNFEFYNRKTKIIALGTFSAAIANIILNILLIPQWGMYGAAFATAISYGLLFVAHYIIVKHLKEMKYHISITRFLPGLLTVIVFSLLFYIFKNYWIIRWGLAIIIGGMELYRIIKRKSIFG